MRRIGWVGLTVAAAGILAVGGYVWAQHAAETRARARIDAGLAENGLAGAVRYGALSVDPLSAGGSVSDISFTENGAVVWRIDRVELRDYRETPKGLPRQAKIAVRGVHLAFAQWAKDCAETGASCAYAANADELREQGVDEMLVDADFFYAMDDAAKRFRVAGGLTLRDFVSLGMAVSIGGLDSETLRAVGAWAEEAIQAGVPPMLAAAAFGETAGKSIETLDIGGFGFAMTDLGAVRRRIEIQAKKAGDTRPPAEILRERVAEVQADIRGSAQPWMAPEFVESMAAALEPFAFSGKPYRITSGEAAPVVLLRRGAVGLEFGPELADPGRLFRALSPKVDNRPL